MSEKIRVLLSEEEVDARIQEVADMINKDYDGKDVHTVSYTHLTLPTKLEV